MPSRFRWCWNWHSNGFLSKNKEKCFKISGIFALPPGRHCSLNGLAFGDLKSSKPSSFSFGDPVGAGLSPIASLEGIGGHWRSASLPGRRRDASEISSSLDPTPRVRPFERLDALVRDARASDVQQLELAQGQETRQAGIRHFRPPQL